MILHWDGSWPLLMIVLMALFFVMAKKDKIKREKELQASNDYIENKYKEKLDIDLLILDGVKKINKDNYKYLSDCDFDKYSKTYGVKFI